MDIDKIFINMIWLLSRESAMVRFMLPVVGRAQGCWVFLGFLKYTKAELVLLPAQVIMLPAFNVAFMLSVLE